MKKIEIWFKLFLKKIAASMPVNFYQRPLAFSIINKEFPQLQETMIYPVRERLWDLVLNLVEEQPVNYVEFGVLEGSSIKYFANKNNNPESTFVGLDSFVGLPDDWDGIPKGTLSVGGRVPVTDDARIAFLRGWFNDTSQILLKHLQKCNLQHLIVNFDADLYSSTLFALTEIDTLKKNYLAIFDEFAGHESRALFNYIQSHNAKVTFIGRVLFDHQPWCVLCKIEPHIPTANSQSVIGSIKTLV
jgi:hypothetical protein